ncbi:MAG: hypothetical protein ACK5PB_23780, partial [Pirellula sp.]
PSPRSNVFDLRSAFCSGWLIVDVRRQEIMTQSKLLTVEGVFDIPGRGLIVVPGPLVDSFASPSEISVTLKRPDGQVIDATASITFHFQTPPPKEHRFAVILKGPAKSDVPIGTEIWFEKDDDD